MLNNQRVSYTVKLGSRLKKTPDHHWIPKAPHHWSCRHGMPWGPRHSAVQKIGIEVVVQPIYSSMFFFIIYWLKKGNPESFHSTCLMIHSPFSFASPTSLLASGPIILNPKIHSIEIVILMVTSLAIIQHHRCKPWWDPPKNPSPWRISKKKGQCPIAPVEVEAAGKNTWAHRGDKVGTSCRNMAIYQSLWIQVPS